MKFEPGTIKTVATILLGEPNAQLSKPDELRFGSHGSLAIAVEQNTFYDHEQNAGGGILDLISRETGGDKAGAFDWLVEHGLASPEPQKVKPRLVSSYDYRGESGDLLFQVVRFEPKDFRQRKPDGAGGWTWKVKGVRQVPYRLPELMATPLSETIYIVEGEKDADNLAALGLVATCNAGGAGKWRDSHSECLAGRTAVCIIPDNDAAGRDHAQKVARSLRKANPALMVRILELPDLPEKGDVSDWLAAGGTVEELQKLKTTGPEKADTDSDSEEAEKRSQTDRLVEYAREQFELIHDNNGDVYACDHRTGEVRRLSGRQFKDRLVAGFFDKFKMATREASLREALGTLQAIGRFTGEPQQVSIRVAAHGGKYYVDLCESGNSRAIELGAGYWKIVAEPPVKFVRGDAMQPLPTPIQGGSITPLWKIANIPDKMRLLVVTWLIDALRPNTPYPGLELIGEQGSGKSTAAEALRRVIDPSSCNLRGAPKTVEDIFVAAGQNHVVAYENVSHLVGPMQDALAILSTGGGYSTRKHYTNGEEHIISVRRPWLINGISIAVTQQDLVDRVISIECPVIETRQSSSKQWAQFERDLPGIFGGLLDTAAKAMAILPTMTLAPADRPRLVEFVMLGQAVAKSAGYNDFLQRFNELRAETVARTLDSSPVATAVLEFVEASPSGITASVKDIMSRLEHHKPIGAEFWPRSPKGLGDALRRAAPALRQMGIECRSAGKVHGVICWAIRKKTTDTKSSKSPKSPDVPDFDGAGVDLGDLGDIGDIVSAPNIDQAAEFEI